MLKMLTHKCKCGGRIQEDTTFFEGLILGCFRCQKCGDLSFSAEQAKERIRLRDIDRVLSQDDLQALDEARQDHKAGKTKRLK